MLVHRLRRWCNIDLASNQCIVCTGSGKLEVMSAYGSGMFYLFISRFECVGNTGSAATENTVMNLCVGLMLGSVGHERQH